MALTGLEIYKQLPKTNCKECGFPTCLAFAMQLAAKKVGLDKCPHVTAEAKAALEGASAPPIQLVTIGSGDKKLEVGNETVMFRHEETFHHPTGIGFVVEDSLPPEAIEKKVSEINKLRFDRVGQTIEANLVAIAHTSSNGNYAGVVEKVAKQTSLGLVLVCPKPEVLEPAIKVCANRRPLLYAATQDNWEKMAKLAKENNLPLAVLEKDLEKLADLTQKIKSMGVTEMVLDTGPKPITEKVKDLTTIRRLALKKTFRALGYPVISFTQSQDTYPEAQEAASLILKYSSIVLMKNTSNWQVMPLLTLRGDIYTDPQKPSQVEPKFYEIGNVTDKSPVLITTNFSITYYTVEGEVESSKVPSYLISANAEGMSVLTAWAAEKFTAETIAATLDSCGIKEKVSHKNIIIPGYVAVLSGKLEELTGWKVIVGPREASGLSSFLKQLR